MKNAIAWMLMGLLCLLPAGAAGDSLAEPDFRLEMETVFPGMGYRSWLQGYEPTIANDTLSVCLPISSLRAEGAITAELILRDDTVSPLRPQELSKRFSSEDGVYPVRLTLRLLSPRYNGDFSAVVRVTGEDGSGNPLSADFPVVIRVRDGAEPDNAALPAISGIEADLRPGEKGAVRGWLRNAGRYAEMRDVRLILTDDSGDILPAGTNEQALPDLSPGDDMEFSYPVCVLPEADAAPRAVRFIVRYRALGVEREYKLTHTLSISQEIRLEQGGLTAPETVVQGDSVSLSLPLFNMGRGTLRNVLATLSLPGIAERQSVLIGSLAPGESKTAMMSFTPGRNALGEYGGTILVEGEDEWGDKASFSLPLEITVEAPAKSALSPDTAAVEEEKPPLLLYGLGCVCGILAAALALQGVLLRRKIRALEEDTL